MLTVCLSLCSYSLQSCSGQMTSSRLSNRTHRLIIDVVATVVANECVRSTLLSGFILNFFSCPNLRPPCIRIFSNRSVGSRVVFLVHSRVCRGTRLRPLECKV